jgi:hypothetical protein
MMLEHARLGRRSTSATDGQQTSQKESMFIPRLTIGGKFVLGTLLGVEVG